MAKYPLVAASDCSVDVKQDVVDVCVTACERHGADVEKCTQTIKEALDKRWGGPWHVVVGRAFAFEITHEVGAAGWRRLVGAACAAGVRRHARCTPHLL